jgi:RNA-directed DNA polymerase
LERYPTTEQLELWEFENYWQYAYIKGRGLPGKLTILRQKLYQKAKQEPRFRFYALYDRIWRWDAVNCAYEIVRSKKGVAGVDRVSFDDIEANLLGIEGFLKDIQDSLRNKTYKPDAVRRVYIPKPDGRQRPLGIPTIRDRVVQMATLLIL